MVHRLVLPFDVLNFGIAVHISVKRMALTDMR
jgi:hypothetical protein